MNKRVNVYNKTTGMLQRTTRSHAGELVRGGEYAYTTKSKLKSFLIREVKLTKNMNFLTSRDVDLTTVPTFKMPSGKIHAVVNDNGNRFNRKRNIWRQHFIVQYST